MKKILITMIAVIFSVSAYAETGEWFYGKGGTALDNQVQQAMARMLAEYQIKMFANQLVNQEKAQQDAYNTQKIYGDATADIMNNLKINELATNEQLQNFLKGVYGDQTATAAFASLQKFKKDLAAQAEIDDTNRDRKMFDETYKAVLGNHVWRQRSAQGGASIVEMIQRMNEDNFKGY
ncbi:MAG: hypothetical protein V1647_04965 [Pseudomonadota bacterium]